MKELATMKITKKLLEELRIKKEETKIPMLALLEMAWETYKQINDKEVK